MCRGYHRVTGTEEHHLLFSGELEEMFRVLLHVLTEETVYRFPVILLQRLNGRSHEARCITFQKNVICLPDAGKALLRDVRFIKQAEADKGQHGCSPGVQHLFRFITIPLISMKTM
jgi:hypothetical protein